MKVVLAFKCFQQKHQFNLTIKKADTPKLGSILNIIHPIFLQTIKVMANHKYRSNCPMWDKLSRDHNDSFRSWNTQCVVREPWGNSRPGADVYHCWYLTAYERCILLLEVNSGGNWAEHIETLHSVQLPCSLK